MDRPSLVRGLPSLLERLGLAQTTLATHVGVAPETVSRWVSGRLSPHGRNLAKTLAYLREHDPSITFDDLIKAA
jgi:DNA-binding transcriptional regulator YiaG